MSRGDERNLKMVEATLKGATYKEIAAEQGITQSRVHQIVYYELANIERADRDIGVKWPADENGRGFSQLVNIRLHAAFLMQRVEFFRRQEKPISRNEQLKKERVARELADAQAKRAKAVAAAIELLAKDGYTVTPPKEQAMSDSTQVPTAVQYEPIFSTSLKAAGFDEETSGVLSIYGIHYVGDLVQLPSKYCVIGHPNLPAGSIDKLVAKMKELDLHFSTVMPGWVRHRQ